MTSLQAYHGPLIALAVTLGLAVAGRFLRVAWLGAAAGGAGVIAGWYAITGHLSVVMMPASVDQLTQIAVGALLVGLLCAWRGSGHVATLGSLVAALAVGWCLSGEPTHAAALRASWPIGLGVIIAVWLFVRMVGDRALDPLRLALGGLTLAAALHVAGTPMHWVQLALVPGIAALAMSALPSMPGLGSSGLVTLPVAVDIAALGCLAVITLGRLPRLGFGTVDAAALSSLLAVWLSPRMAERLSFAGRAAPLFGCLLAGTVAVGCVFLARQLLHR